MTFDERYELVLTPRARRAVREDLPIAVAAAALDVLTETLVVRPRRVGKPLRGELAGKHWQRRGTYRVPHRI